MQLRRFLDRSLVRRALTWALPALGVLLLVLLLWPGSIQLADADATPAVVAESDPAWGFAAEDGPADSELAGAEVYAALVPESAVGESLREIDDSWLSAEDVPADASDSATLACIIEPFHVIEIGSAVTGLIETIHVERSDFVAAGQVLVELEAGAERAAVRLARSQAEMNEAIKSREASALLGEHRRNRVARLYEQNTLSLDQREEAETEAEVARLELEQAHAEKRLASLQLDHAVALLERRTIRSPLAGVVVERLMDPGERVDEEVILELAQIDPLRVEVILPSSAFGSVEVGMRAAVVPEFPGDTVHVASVTIVDRVIDAASGTFGVRLELPNPERDIPGGLHCQVRFLTE
jgi:RND family efflux transporter MFP subunit